MNPAPDPPDRGTGMLGTSLGVTVFLLLLLVAVQVLFDLYATTLVTSAAQAAAVEVASHDAAEDRCGAATSAEERFRTALGGYARRGDVSLTWTCSDPDVVRVTVVGEHPSLLPARVAGLLPLGHIERTIEVRVEAPR